MGISTQTPIEVIAAQPDFYLPDYYLSGDRMASRSANFPTPSDRVTPPTEQDVRVNSEWAVRLDQFADSSPGAITLSPPSQSIRSIATIVPLGGRFLTPDWSGNFAFDTHDVVPKNGGRFMRQPVIIGGGSITIPAGTVVSQGRFGRQFEPASVTFRMTSGTTATPVNFTILRSTEATTAGSHVADVIGYRTSEFGRINVIARGQTSDYVLRYSLRLWEFSGLGSPQIELVIENSFFRPRANVSSFGLQIDLVALGTDSTPRTFRVSDHEYRLPERSDTTIDPPPQPVACIPTTQIDGDMVAFAVADTATEPQVVAEFPTVLSSGIYAITFDSSGYFPDLELRDLQGNRSKITRDDRRTEVGLSQSPFRDNRAGFYFRSYTTLTGTTLNTPRRIANFPAAILVIAPPGSSGTLHNVRIISVAEVSTAHRYEPYQSPVALPHHVTGGQQIIVHTGEPINFSPLPIASPNHEPRVDSGVPSFSEVGGLTYDNTTGELSGSFTEVGIFRFLEMEVKVFTRFSYRSGRVPRNNTPAIILDPDAVSDDGSFGHVSPEFTDDRTGGFTVDVDFGALPDGFVLEPTGEIWHSGAEVRNAFFFEGPIRFRLTADDGTVLWSPNYLIGQERPNPPSITYGNFTNDPTGTRDNQIHWDTRYPVGDVRPNRTFFLYGQPAIFVIESGSLPPGINFDTTSGALTGQLQPGQASQSGRIAVRVTNYQGVTSRNVAFVFWSVIDD